MTTHSSLIVDSDGIEESEDSDREDSVEGEIVGVLHVCTLDGDLSLLLTRLVIWVVESVLADRIRRLIIPSTRASQAYLQSRDVSILLLLFRSLLPLPHRRPSAPTSS